MVLGWHEKIGLQICEGMPGLSKTEAFIPDAYRIIAATSDTKPYLGRHFIGLHGGIAMIKRRGCCACGRGSFI